MKRILIITIVVAALGGLFTFGLLRGAPDRNIKSALVGNPAPDFELILYGNRDYRTGDQLVMSEQEGKVVVVNFWASWCAPCYDEAPHLQNVWNEYRNDGDVLFVGIQTQDKDRFSEGQAFIDQFGLTFPNGMDNDSKISVRWALHGVPETFFVGKDGRIAYKHIGPLTSSVLREQVSKLR